LNIPIVAAGGDKQRVGCQRLSILTALLLPVPELQVLFVKLSPRASPQGELLIAGRPIDVFVDHDPLFIWVVRRAARASVWMRPEKHIV
jgi:hypothetical protein